jgi:hypothetical protein
VGRVAGDALLLDARTLLEGDAEEVEAALGRALIGPEPSGTVPAHDSRC